MASPAKIVDLYGLPACGKSSLVAWMVAGSPSGLRVADKRMALGKGGAAFFCRFLLSLHPKDVYRCVLYHFAIPPRLRRKDSPLRKFIKNYAYYRYVAKYSGYDVVYMDNGIVQSIVSHQGGADLLDDRKYISSVRRLLDLPLDITFVRCDIDAEAALNRMRQRGREKGRIDLMDDPERQLQSLEEEDRIYRKFSDFISAWGFPQLTVNSNLSIEQESEQLRAGLRYD